MASIDKRAGAVDAQVPIGRVRRKVVFASALGTLFEWYDFYLYGAMAVIIAKQFFNGPTSSAEFIFALLAFAAGFIVRPFGAVLFGRVGDLVGRKYTFLITLLIMGLATFIVGLLPNYATIGMAAPVMLIALRLLQGLAIGGEYAGAAIYVAEHAPQGRRGEYTAWVQTTATLGLLLSLAIVLGTRTLLGEPEFEAWGWRIPFLVSIVLLFLSVYIRLDMPESPAFVMIKVANNVSWAPLTESFARWRNGKAVLLALFGLTAGQAVVWYTGHFYALFFLTQTLQVDAVTASVLVAAALILGAPFFVAFGALSDKVGRKPVIMVGCVLAAVSYFPAFEALTFAANPGLARAQAQHKVRLYANPAECSFQFSLTGTGAFTSACDVAKQALAAASVGYKNVPVAQGVPVTIAVGSTVVPSYSGAGLGPRELAARSDAFLRELTAALGQAGYPANADPAQLSRIRVVAILTYLVVLVALVYDPLAAMLVEMFPTRIRYTSISLPYHIGNGWFGGVMPSMAFAVVAYTGNMYSGLWYPVIVAGVTFVVGLLWLRETKDVDIFDSGSTPPT